MLKTIPTTQVKLGMHIHALNGAWVEHPFWKTKFVLEDPTDLKKLLASNVKEVVIDVSKGLDVEQPKQNKDKSVEEPQEKKALSVKVGEEKVSAQAEFKAAKRAINASRLAVSSMFNDVRMGKVVSADAAMPLVADIAASVSRNQNALISLVRLKTKDDYTYMHSVAVCAMMVALAKQLNLSELETRQAGLAGLMHDIGKAGIPLEVLNKPGALTEEEFNLVKLHPERGHELLLEAGINDETVLDVCLHHHEKMDGTGYPGKFKDEQISLFAKMGAVCDVYDAITSNRPYKSGWDPGVSLQRMAQWKGHFDETIFKAFVKSLGIYPIGSTLKLKSGRLAVVIDQSPKSLLTPIVKVFFSTKTKSRIPISLIDLSKSNERDTIIGYEDPALWGIMNIDEVWSQFEIWD
jgi:HD-GYP domain-containing protein (c-di-GMP phosphodiesterase class II)